MNGIICGDSLRAGSDKSKVSSHLRSIHALLTIENMEVGTYHFTRGPKS